MRLLLDEMLPAAIAAQLRKRRHDVTAVTERTEMRGLSDGELFELAQREERAVVTYNREDFTELDRQYRVEDRIHHGIVILSPKRFPQEASTIGRVVTSLDALCVSGAPYPRFIHWLQ